ncbi:MAG: protein kinase [Kofleriaceae bacterium]
MSTGPGGKPSSGDQGSAPLPGAGRPPAETPQRLVVRSGDHPTDSMLGANDTAVANASASPQDESSRAKPTPSTVGIGPTPAIGMSSLSEIVGVVLSGRYLVTRKVGQGGMGAVYEATHTLIGKRVAVKVLLEKYAQREAIVARLKQEAQLASSIGNEHIIDITDFGTTEDGRTFVVMEFLDGESLAECLARETRLGEKRILKIVAQAAAALAAAHAQGIVHRDIKPENLFLLQRKDEDFVKVVDFGISKSLRSTSEEEDQPKLTQTGMVLGTPLYMSPEQARGDDMLDARVDLYALGVIMYETATGRVPVIGNNYLSVISQVLNEQPKSPRELRPELSEEFEAVVLKAMEKDRDERYTSANEMLADVTALLDDPTHSTERAKITGPRRRRIPKPNSLRGIVWAAGIAVIIAAVAVTVKMMMAQPKEPVAAVVVDAGVAVIVDAPAVAPIDAAVEVTEMMDLAIVTVPAGAKIFQDNVEVLGKVTPMSVQVVKKNKEIAFSAQVEGFDELVFTVNPLERKEKGPIKVTLRKAKRGTGIRIDRGSGSGTGSAQGSRTGGEMSGYPGGGIVPPKK